MSKDQPRQHRLLNCTFTRDELTLLASAVMQARSKAATRASSARGLDKRIVESLLEGYGNILNKLENSPWIY